MSKVSIVRCNSYRDSEVFNGVSRAVELLGGISYFIKDKDGVFLKPNLLSAVKPDEGVDTHIEFIRAVIRLVKQAGGVCKVGDSPGGCIRDTQYVYESSGIKQLAIDENVELVNFDKAVDIEGYPIAEAVRNCAILINLPKAKTHTLAIITGAIKNLYGTIPGLAKVAYHLKAPHHIDFASILVDIYQRTRPGLSIMDGIVAMEGDGPSAGPLTNLGLILASADGVALDAVFAALIGLDGLKVPVIKEAHRRGLGCGDIKEVEIVGEKLEDVKPKGFKLPKTSLLSRVPSALAHPIERLIKFLPSVDKKRCNRCGLCLESCPKAAITMGDAAAKIDYSKCISCFCCSEVCTQKAISVRRSLLAWLGTRNWVID